ncbi:MAG: toxin-antitoxin system HicB family antitoxin [Proteobacteria bacterium]|nr:toxin-antitoxin system HicB family antitoxin [Pseudomonadota bacterium]
MSTLSLRLPDSLHERVKNLSKVEGVSINQFITLALTEKMSYPLIYPHLPELVVV